MPAPGEPRYFLDHDGRVFLVRDGGVLRLPLRGEVPFTFEEKHVLTLRGQRVVFGGPVDKATHQDWHWKDDLPFLDHVEAIARSAANLTIPRVVAKAAFRRGDEVLLVKPSIGFYKGRWSLAGGYIDYGETPEACVVREAEEELGVKSEVVRLLRVDSQVVSSGIQFITFHYEGRVLGDRLTLKEDEIAEARWFPLEQAVREVASEHGRLALAMLLREERPA